MKCPKCSTELEQGAKFCGNCGAVVPQNHKAEVFSPQPSDSEATTVLSNNSFNGGNTSFGNNGINTQVHSPANQNVGYAQPNEIPKNEPKNEPKIEQEFVFCNSCGFKNSADSAFCMNCGIKMNDTEASAPATQNNNTYVNQQPVMQNSQSSGYQQPQYSTAQNQYNNPQQNYYSGNPRPNLGKIFSIFKAPVNNGITYVSDGSVIENSIVIVAQKILLSIIPLAFLVNMFDDLDAAVAARSFFSVLFVSLVGGFGFPLIMWFFDKIVFKGTSSFQKMSGVVATKEMITVPFFALAAILGFIVQDEAIAIPIVLITFGLFCGMCESVKVYRGATDADENKQLFTICISWFVTALVVFLLVKMMLSGVIEDIQDSFFDFSF